MRKKTPKTEPKTDCWKLFDSVLPHSRRILLWGPPGTGKTHQASRAGITDEDRVFSVTMTEESAAAELRGFFVPRGGQFEWQDGPAISAWRREGVRLVVNEIDRSSADCLSLFYAILDDPELARLTLPSGETVKPSQGFSVIATMNGSPDCLPSALRDRFPVKINIDKIHPSALKSLPSDLRRAAAKTVGIDDSRGVSVRGWAAFAALRQNMPANMAAHAVFGDSAKDVLVALRMGKK